MNLAPELTWVVEEVPTQLYPIAQIGCGRELSRFRWRVAIYCIDTTYSLCCYYNGVFLTQKELPCAPLPTLQQQAVVWLHTLLCEQQALMAKDCTAVVAVLPS